METPKITVNEALIIAKEYHLEAEVTECIKQGMSPIEALIEWDCTKEGYDFWKGLNDKYKSIWEMSDSGALLLLSDC